MLPGDDSAILRCRSLSCRPRLLMCLRIINPPAKDSGGISDGIQIRVS